MPPSNDVALALYRQLRDRIDAIHDLATSIEEDVSRAQIYEDATAIQRALAKMHHLTNAASTLEQGLILCGSHHSASVVAPSPRVSHETELTVGEAA